MKRPTNNSEIYTCSIMLWRSYITACIYSVCNCAYRIYSESSYYSQDIEQYFAWFLLVSYVCNHVHTYQTALTHVIISYQQYFDTKHFIADYIS